MMDIVFQQANESLKSFSIADKEALIYNLVESLMFVTDDVQEKVIDCLKLVNEDLGATIQKQL
ncbi:MAG: catalase-related domain-containing protein [Aminipila sp.]